MDCILETTGIQYALGILRITCGPVGSSGSTVLQVFVCGSMADLPRAPLFYRCLFADIFEMHAESSTWEIFSYKLTTNFN